MLFLLFLISTITTLKTDNPRNLYFLLKQGIESEQEQICSLLKEIIKPSYEDLYFTKLILNDLDDCHIDFPEPHNKDKDDFQTYYFTTLIDLLENKNENCIHLSKFIGSGGAGKVHLSKTDDNYKIAAQMYYLAYKCKFNQQENDFTLPIQEALINMQEIYTNHIAFLDRDHSLSLTAQFLYSYLQFNLTQNHPTAQRYYEEQIFQKCILNLLNHNQNTGSLQQQYWVQKVLSHPKIINSIQAQIGESFLKKNKTTQIPIKFTNLKGEKIQPSTNFTILLSNKDGLEQITYTPTPKSKEFNGYVETIRKGKIQLIINFIDYKLFYYFQINSILNLDEIMFSVVNSKTQKPSFKYGVEDGELYPKVLEATENSYLHVIFKIEQSINPQQVAIRLIHPQYPLATTQVLAEFDSKKSIYYTIIDFGDPEHVSPVNGKYQVEILIAAQDYLPKRFVFAQIEAKFQTQSIPQNDSYHKLQPSIIHQFAPDEPEVPFIFVSFFIGVTILAFVFYLNIMKNLDINFDKIPKDGSQLIVYAFIALLLAIFVVLTLFWIKLNLIETISILGVLSVPLVLVGNFALLSLRKSEKQD